MGQGQPAKEVGLYEGVSEGRGADPLQHLSASHFRTSHLTSSLSFLFDSPPAPLFPGISNLRLSDGQPGLGPLS